MYIHTYIHTNKNC